jgi:hypothetical protein
MNKFLIFIDGADDAAMWPMSSLLEVSVAADATILMRFRGLASGTGDDEGNSLVTLTCTADTELKVFKSIADAIGGKSFKSTGYVVVADDVNSSYVDSDITACAITLDS